MKISQEEVEPTFRPVTITLDTLQEVRAMRAIAINDSLIDDFNIMLRDSIYSDLEQYDSRR
jgi:hypothetical protein